MRNKLIYTMLLFTMIFVSCGEQENIQFDADNGQVMSKFVGSNTVQPVVAEGTAFSDIKVQVTTKSDSDRTIEVVAGENSSATPNQYTITNLVIPAGEYEGTIRVSGNYDNIPVGDNFKLELKLLGVSGEGTVTNDVYEVTFFRFCPVQIGTYTIEMHDAYGDGWQTTSDNGDGMTATLLNADGSETVIEFGMCSPYGPVSYDCSGTPATAGYTDATTTITVPEGTKNIIWEFPGDRYGEISFEIYAPNGNVLYESGAPGAQDAAILPPFIYCL